jgi:uncharacterized alkaline shock family protein YloU
MSERGRLRRSPLETERGSTDIEDGVVSKIAGMAAREVEGVRMGGSASRTAGEILGGLTGSQDLSRGVSVEVGRVEAAIDLTMAVEYGRDLLQLAEQVRDRITERVETLTGLQVTELNVTIDDVIFPKEERGRRGGLLSGTRGEARLQEQRTEEQRTEELRTGGRRGHEAADTEVIDVRALSQTRTEAGRRVTEREEGRVEDRPLEENPTVELRLGDEESGGTRRRDSRRR